MTALAFGPESLSKLQTRERESKQKTTDHLVERHRRKSRRCEVVEFAGPRRGEEQTMQKELGSYGKIILSIYVAVPYCL